MPKSLNKYHVGQIRARPELIKVLKILKIHSKINVQDLAEMSILARLEYWKSKGDLDEQIKAIKDDYKHYIKDETRKELLKTQ